MKLCKKCGTEKDDSEFNKRKASADGLSAMCKCCQREYDKSRANDPHRALARAEYQKTERGMLAAKAAKIRWAKNNKEKIYKSVLRYREQNPKKYIAHGKVAYEIRVGNLHQEPCEICGGVDSVAHHDDYDKPLNIRWLCDFHHKQWHQLNGEGANAH
jgi:hypothetical protein